MVHLPSLVRRTTVDIGRAFELHSLRFLNEKLHMSLTQVGGAGDGGVDLRGWWNVPAPSTTSARILSEPGSDPRAGTIAGIRKLRVLGQCKAERKALGPRAVRELEGVMAHQRGEFHHYRSYITNVLHLIPIYWMRIGLTTIQVLIRWIQ